MCLDHDKTMTNAKSRRSALPNLTLQNAPSHIEPALQQCRSSEICFSGWSWSQISNHCSKSTWCTIIARSFTMPNSLAAVSFGYFSNVAKINGMYKSAFVFSSEIALPVLHRSRALAAPLNGAAGAESLLLSVPLLSVEQPENSASVSRFTVTCFSASLEFLRRLRRN